MSESEALKARDKQTTETQTQMIADGLTYQDRLKAIDIELGYGDSTKQPTEEHKNKLLKERLDLLAKMMRRKT
jgi:hypothetical protein